MQVKHPSFILACDYPAAMEIFQKNLQGTCVIHSGDDGCQVNQIDNKHNWFEALNHRMHIAQRTYLEENKNFRQLLPYVLITRFNHDGVLEFLTYRRLKGGGEAKLYGNSSIGFGGHVDLIDLKVNTKSVPLLESTLELATIRELWEELAIRPIGAQKGGNLHAPSPNYTGVNLVDSSNDVGMVHLGLVYLCVIPSDYDVKTPEHDKIELGGFKTLDELKAIVDDANFENWSLALIKYLDKFNLLSISATQDITTV